MTGEAIQHAPRQADEPAAKRGVSLSTRRLAILLLLGLVISLSLAAGRCIAGPASPGTAKPPAQPTPDERLLAIAEDWARRGLWQQAQSTAGKAIEAFKESLSKAGDDAPGELTAGLLKAHRLRATCLARLNRPTEALPHYEQAVSLTRRLHDGKDHNDVVDRLADLVGCQRVAGKLADRLATAKQLAEMCDRLDGDKVTERRAMTRLGVGVALLDVDQPDQAVAPLRASLVMQRELLGDRPHASLANTLGVLGRALRLSQSPAEALKHYTQAEAMYRVLTRGRDHPQWAIQLEGIGLCHRDLGQHAEALTFTAQSLAMLRRLSGGRDHASLAEAMSRISFIYAANGKFDEAAKHGQEALAMTRRRHGINSEVAEQSIGKNTAAGVPIAEAHKDLAELYGQMGQHERAAKHHKRTVALYRGMLEGRDHIRLAYNLLLAGKAAQNLKRLTEAEALTGESVAMYRRLSGGKDHPSLALAMAWHAICLAEMGQLDPALKQVQQADAMMRRVLGEKPHIRLAATAEAHGIILSKLSRFGEALPHHQRALAIRRKVLQGEQMLLSMSLDHISDCYEGLGQSDRAIEASRQSLAIQQRLHRGNDSESQAVTWQSLGRSHVNLGAFEEAKQCYARALAMRERMFGKMHVAVARSLSEIAHLHTNLGNPASALPLLDRARSIFQAAPREAALYYRPEFHIAAGDTLIALGRASEALTHFEQAAQLQHAFYGDRPHHKRTQAYDGISRALRATGRIDAGMRFAIHAARMRHTLYGETDHPQRVDALAEWSYALALSAEHTAAIERAREALAMAQRLAKENKGDRPRPELVAAMGNLAFVYSLAGQHDRGEAAWRDYIAILTKHLGERQTPALADAWSVLASSLYRQGKFTEALPSYERALAIKKQFAAADTYREQSFLAWTLLSMKRLDDAAKAFEAAIALQEQSRTTTGGSELDQLAFAQHSRIGKPIEGMVKVQLLRGDASAALRYAERGSASALHRLLERGQARAGSPGGEDMLSPVIAHAKANDDQELINAATLLRDQHQDAASKLDAITAQLRLLESQSSRGDGDERRAVLSRTTEQKQQAQAAYQSVRRAMLNLVNRVGPQGDGPPTDASIQRAIAAVKPDEALLFYTYVEDRLVLLSKPPTGSEGATATFLRWPDGRPVTSSSLDKAIQRYLQSMMIEGRAARSIGREKPVQRRQNANLGHDLFRALLPSKVWSAVRTAKRSYVVPGGGLHRLPFEALIVTKPGDDDLPAEKRRYWLDEGPPIVYGPSLRVVMRQRLTATPTGKGNTNLDSPQSMKLVVLADPAFQSAEEQKNEAGPGDKAPAEAGPTTPSLERRNTWKPLPGTRREARSIYQAWTGQSWDDDAEGKTSEAGQAQSETPPAAAPQGSRQAEVVMLLGEEARAERLHDAAAGARVLHLATHGIAESGPEALYSGLALAAPKQGDSDDPGILTLGAILDRWRGRLRNTDLVVLSACDSRGVDDAGRNVHQGEGVFGLPWGFLYAGARSVIASQWSVDDESTAVLMASLYERIGKAYRGGEPPELANTFVAVRKKLRATYPEPYFWAPFVLIGSPD